MDSRVSSHTARNASFTLRSMVRSLLRNRFLASCWVIENSRPYRDPNADIPKRVLMTRTSKVRIHFRTARSKFDN